MTDVAFYHPEIEVPIDPVLEAPNYPRTLDLNKATLLAMLRLR